jgi:hypothetical protein
MSKLASRVLIASMFFVVLAPVMSYAQITNEVDVNVPFKFYAANTLLPAGKYTIRVSSFDDPNFLLIESADGGVGVFLDTESAQTPVGKTSADTNLDFNRVKGHEFLSKIWVEGKMTGYQILPSHFEQKLEKAGASGEHHSVKAIHKNK